MLRGIYILHVIIITNFVFFLLQEYVYDYDGHTGDPNLDLEYERNYFVAKIPDVVKKFIPYFRSVINQGVIFEIQNLYENTWPKLSEEYYDKRSWPNEEEIAVFIDTDEVFKVLYKELYFRHIMHESKVDLNLNNVSLHSTIIVTFSI